MQNVSQLEIFPASHRTATSHIRYFHFRFTVYTGSSLPPAVRAAGQPELSAAATRRLQYVWSGQRLGCVLLAGGRGMRRGLCAAVRRSAHGRPHARRDLVSSRQPRLDYLLAVGEQCVSRRNSAHDPVHRGELSYSEELVAKTKLGPECARGDML